MLNEMNLLIIYLILIFQINGQLFENDSNETTTQSLTTELTITIESTTITTPEICTIDLSEYLNVTLRESRRFNAIIRYNCSLIDISELSVFVGEEKFDGCILEKNIEENNEICLTCHSIENYAGRNWNFSIIQMNSNEQIIVNQSFTITLSPESLDLITNLSVEIDENILFAKIFIENCTIISQLEYLVFQCNENNSEYRNLSEDCTIICLDIEPGSIYNSTLIRLPIPIFDQFNKTFDEEHRSIIYQTNLDQVTNIQFDIDSNLISFDCPRGNYDNILLNCSAQDQSCSNNQQILNSTIEICLNQTSIVFLPITKGVSYKCNAFTNKFNFSQVKSEDFYFNTPLQSAFIENPSRFYYLNRTDISLDISIESDFNSIESYCFVDLNTIDINSNICMNLTINNQLNCSTNIQLKTIYGCNYFCYFITKKINYNQQISTNYSIMIYPIKPIVIISKFASRWILINWIFNEIVYKKSYQFLLDGTAISIGDKRLSSYNYTNLNPFHSYKISIILNSNRNITSNISTVLTLQEPPPIPSAEEIKNKIIPSNQTTNLNTNQYLIEIDSSLFLNTFGPIISYKIYVRQDQTKNSSLLGPIGTYSQAYSNESLDYLALIIPIQKTEINLRLTKNKIRLLIGNQTICSQQSNSTIPCNGKLKADKTYRLVVSGCTSVGCTDVLSPSFHTQNIPQEKSSNSKEWIVIFPILLFVGIFILIIWKRKQLKNFYQTKTIQRRQKDRMSVTFDRQSGNERIKMSLIIEPIKPKYLFQYINLTADDEKSIYNEYKDLEDLSPVFRQSNVEQEHSIYDRYANIYARGPWNHTAIRLIGDYRIHDYINANQIQSYDNKKMYIACQGPIKSTCQDFWDMIVQFEVTTIIMLTKLEEKNPHSVLKPLPKCFGYFPMNVNQSMKFGRLTIKLIRIENNSKLDLEIRHILITEDINKSYNLIHYYFTGWPDYNVIEAGKLLELIEFINDHRKRTFIENSKGKHIESNPIVVHCSAGVGRTGTYIAVETIDRLLRKCSDYELNTMKLDVMGIVLQLRKDRSKMVQTKEQYLLVNRCVEEYLKRNHRLNLITKRSDLSSYGKRASKFQRSSSEYVDIPFERYSQKRSSTVTIHSNRSIQSSVNRRTTSEQSIDNYYTIQDDQQQPPLPPRRAK